MPSCADAPTSPRTTTKTIGYDVLRHRVAPSYEAEAEDLSSEALLRMLFDGVPVP